MTLTLPTSADDHLYLEKNCSTNAQFHCFNFDTISFHRTKELISCLSTKTCELDPMPTHFLKANIHEIIPIICHVVNKSLSEGVFLDDLKLALLHPLLKKAGLDVSQNKKYRPVSNLPYLGKIIEKEACNQIMLHASNTGNTEKYQSAYARNRSTETAILDVMTNVYKEVDKGRVVCLVLLDLSAAFDMVIPELLLNRLHYRFGLGGTVLEWLQSYLTNRKQKVIINGVFFTRSTYQVWGTPRLNLGPLLVHPVYHPLR